MIKNKVAWLVYDQKRFSKAGGYYELYIDYFGQYGFSVELLFAEDIEPSKIVSLPDIAIMRTYSPDLTAYLEKRGVKVFNNSQIAELGNNKHLAYEFIKSLNIDVPYTHLTNRTQSIDIIYPVVVKSIYGHGGEEVFWANSYEEYANIIAKIPDYACLLQKPVSELGKDLRVYVVGNRIVAAMLRHNPNDFRSNFSLGGTAKVYNLTNTEKDMVNKIISELKIGMAGIDFMFDNGKLIFNEIEDVVGARMLYANTDIDIVKLYVDFIISSIN